MSALRSHPDCAVCQKRKATQARWSKAKYEARRKAGLCGKCGVKIKRGALCIACENRKNDGQWRKRNESATEI